MRQPRKILVYKADLLPYSETFIREQVRMLVRWHGVLVGERRLPHGLPLDELDVRVVGYRHRLLNRLARASSRLLTLPPDKPARLRAEHAQLLHVHFGIDAYLIWPVARRLDLPVLVTLHGYDINTERQWWESGRGGFVLRQYPQGLLAMARDPRVHFIAVSHAIRERAIEVGIPPEKISVNYIGVDTRRFVPGGPPLAQRDEVLFVGRLVEKKGCRYLIEAFGQVQDRFPDARLVIVGTGPQEPRLRALAQQLGVRVEFPGSLSPREVRERLLRARVFCLPSITARNGDAEGLGIVLLEAQAAGVPVITSARGGAEEGIVHGSTGFAHAEKDVGALRDGLAALLGNDELATRFGLDGRRHVVENMDIRDCVARLETIYDRHAAIYQPAAVSRPFAAEGTRLGT
jgi:glycosyltransferase involved in cell wall biosynthesis